MNPDKSGTRNKRNKTRDKPNCTSHVGRARRARRATWALPDGVSERLPPGTRHLERMRRTILDTFDAWGYDLVIPPLIEYLDSLLIANDDELDLQTFKLIDQLSGRLLGARADMTPQVARIDAHSLRHRAVNRLCYAGTVLHTRPAGVGESRTPYQFGAEIYGSASLTGDAEIIRLMLAVLHALGLDDLYLDLGHAGVAAALIGMAGLNADEEAVVSDCLRRKSRHEMEACLGDKVPSPVRDMFCNLIDFNGDREALSHVRDLRAASQSVSDALDDLVCIADKIAGCAAPSPVQIRFDLTRSLGYRYQSGITYAVYKPDCRRELARGGRYDDFGKVFGRARPAAGFSADLYFLDEIATSVGSDAQTPPSSSAIFAPCLSQDGRDAVADLRRAIEHARTSGERVLEQLEEGEDAVAALCDREFRLADGKWQVFPLS